MEAKKTGANRLKEAPAILKMQIDRFYDNLRNLRLQGKKAAWCDGFPLPFPLLVAMDIPYVFGDAFAATAAARHREKGIQNVAEKAGYNVEVCSYTRSAMGCARYPEADKDSADTMYQLPGAEFLIIADVGCSMLVNWGDDERRHFDVPAFVIQVPHVFNKGDEVEAAHEITRQLRELVVFLEDMTGRKFEWDKLRQIMADVKEAVTLRKDCMDLGKKIPSPGTFFDMASYLGGINYAIGQPDCVEIFRTLRRELTERVSRKEGAVFNEKYRLYWDGIMCWPKFGHLADKFANLGACVVAGRYTHRGFYSLPEAIDLNKPLESLAINAVASHTNHNIDWLIENVSNMCREFSVDGIVTHAHHTCRPLAAPQLEIMEAVSRRLGIPAVFFEADMADSTYYSDAQVDTRLHALLETIDSRRAESRP